MPNRWSILILVFTMVVILAPAAKAGAQTSSSACLATPTTTANAWRDLFPTGATSNQLCIAGCMKWQQTCNNMAQASFRCFRALFLSLNVLDVVDCNNLTGTEKTDCIFSAKESLGGMLDDLQSDLQNALGVCQSSLSDCINNCLD